MKTLDQINSSSPNRYSALQRLENLKTELSDSSSFVRLKGYFKLTKTEQGWVDALAIRDRALESSVMHWISERSSYDAILNRYQQYDSSLHTRDLPQHYPLRILSGVGSISSGKNIFMFFPQALGLEAKCESDVIGLEFVDVWSNLFRKSIFECVKRVFAIEDQYKILVPLETNLERTVFLSSIFHEIGHRVGPYRVSPNLVNGMDLSEFQTDVFGELATDSLLVLNLPEFPEVGLFIILQRLFWFGRKGFADNPLSAQINLDNDAWIGSYLWQKLIHHSVITENVDGSGLRFHSNKVQACFRSIIDEIDSLASMSRNTIGQKESVAAWMCNQIPCNRNQFFLPASLAALFGKCHDIAEVPHFQPIFKYTQLSKLEVESA